MSPARSGWPPSRRPPVRSKTGRSGKNTTFCCSIGFPFQLYPRVAMSTYQNVSHRASMFCSGLADTRHSASEFGGGQSLLTIVATRPSRSTPARLTTNGAAMARRAVENGDAVPIRLQMMIGMPLRIVTQAFWPLLVYAISVPAMALRWRTVLHGVVGRRLPLGPLVLASLASSFVNNVTAGPGGDACRIIALVRLRFATVSRATAAAIYERLSELPAIVAMVVIALVVFGEAPLASFGLLGWWRLGVSVALLLVIGLAGAWLTRAPIRRAWQRIRRPGGLDAIAVDPTVILVSALWSAAVWTLDVARLWLIARMFDVHIGPAQAAALSTIGIVGGWAPTIGGLGVIEAGLIGGLLVLGVPSTTAIAITAVERGISYGIATVAGAGALMALGGRELWTAMRTQPPAEAPS